MNKRPYRMTARADEARRTGDRIIDAMLQRYGALPYDRIRLEDVAADAQVTAQTVLRRFGSKAGLTVAMAERELGRIAAARGSVAGAGCAATVASLAEHYEKYGALILKMYSEVRVVPGLAELAVRGREYHVRWCADAFDLASAGDGSTRERRLAQVVAVCDARTWAILRLESKLSAAQTRLALHEMLAPLVTDG
jgi:AcrR family transcriptional regulator